MGFFARTWLAGLGLLVALQGHASTGMTISDIGSYDNGDISYDLATALVLQSDGKLVLAGISDNHYALVRYQADGAPDPAFGTAGVVMTPFDVVIGRPNAMALQGDGKLVLAGSSQIAGQDHMTLVRYNSDGSLDTGFDGDGKAVTTFGPNHSYADAMTLQADGKLVAAGSYYDGSNYVFAAARYNSDGSLDTGFGTGGKLTRVVGISYAVAAAVAVQPDGKLLLGGLSRLASGWNFAVMRCNSDGSLDAGFGSGGIAFTATGSPDLRDLLIQPDGKIIAAGTTTDSRGMLLARYNTDGTLDTGFGTAGTTEIWSGMYGYANGLALQADGKIIAAGGSRLAGDDVVGVVRLNSNGTLDTGFDGDGKVITVPSNFYSGANGVVVQPDGRIVVGGYSRDRASSDNFLLVRYNVDGTLDTGFGYIPPSDIDGDGYYDNTDPYDSCPYDGDLYGLGVDGSGCPIMPDSDGDGYYDPYDSCPYEGDQGYGLDGYGCPLSPPDSDGDGYADPYDSCPFQGDQGYGLDGSGCPYPPPSDSDGDGYTDDMDYCPSRGDEGYGVDWQGCPYTGGGDYDSDGDGIYDSYDSCPYDGDLYGAGVDGSGCPIMPDSDGDGYYDPYDGCPYEGDQGAGVDSNGCPLTDTDGDGMPDNYDICLTVGDQGHGTDTAGCPVPPPVQGSQWHGSSVRERVLRPR